MRKLLVIGLAAALSLGASQAFAACNTLKQLGNIKLQQRGGVWGIPVGINGVPKTMMLDTGMGITLISPETVEELKLPTRPTSNALLVSSTGERSYGYTNIKALALVGAGQFTNSDYIIDVPLAGGAKRPITAPAGYIGLELLSHFDFDMDLKNGVLNLFDLDHCDGQVIYWKTDSAVWVPFAWDPQGRIRFKVTLDGTQLYAVMNTMDSDDALNLNYYKSQVKFDETAADTQLLGETGDGGKLYRHTFSLLDLGGIGIKNPSVVLREDKLKQVARSTASIGSNIRDTETQREPDITLGVSTMAKLHIYVASKEKKIYISPPPQ